MKDVALVKRQFLNQNNKKDKEWDGWKIKIKKLGDNHEETDEKRNSCRWWKTNSKMKRFAFQFALRLHSIRSRSCLFKARGRYTVYSLRFKAQSRYVLWDLKQGVDMYFVI
jgi:hypothetical protein